MTRKWKPLLFVLATILFLCNVPVLSAVSGNGAANLKMDEKADSFSDGTPLEEKLSKYEKYFSYNKYRFYASLRDGASLYRSGKNGESRVRLVDAACEIVGVDGGYIYYINCSDEYKLYRVDINGKHNGKLIDRTMESVELRKGKLYFYSLSNGLEYCSSDLNGKNIKRETSEMEIRKEDWIISDPQTVEGKTIFLNGNLTIREEASLTLRNCRLIFNTGMPGQTVTERKFTAEERAVGITIENCRIMSTNPMCGIKTYFRRTNLNITNSRLAGLSGGINLDYCENPVITDNLFYNRMEFECVRADWDTGMLIRDNIMIMPFRKDERPPVTICIAISHCSDSKVADNVFVRQQEVIYFFTGANNNLISGNMILGDEYFAGLSVRHDAGNNTFEGNFIQAYYNNGYNQYTRDRWNFGIFIDTCVASNIFRNNTIVNCWTGIGARFMSNSIFDSNRISSRMKKKQAGDVEPLLGIECIHSYNNRFINNTFEGVDGDGSMFLSSPDNTIAGNSFRGYNYGMGIWYGSNGNTIQGNLLDNNTVGIVTDKTNKNVFTGNTFRQGSRYKSFAYDSGLNQWSENFWGKKTIGKYNIAGGGTDGKPLAAAPKTAAYESSGYLNAYAAQENNESSDRLFVTDHVLIRDKIQEFEYFSIVVEKGGTLELRNSTLKCTEFRNAEPEFEIRQGGTLIVDNSKIIAGDKDIFMGITAYGGSKVTVRNSTFKNLINFDIQCDGAVFEKTVFDGCFRSLNIYGRSNKVTGCTFSNCYSGLNIEKWNIENNSIKNNKTMNSVLNFTIPKK